MLPFASADLPGLSGSHDARDRSCEEVLIKQAARTGKYLWLKVAKINLGTQQARAAVARAANASEDLVECAGHRDRAGRCIQWFSVPEDKVENPGALRRAGTQGKMQVLELTASHKPVTPELVERLRWTVRLRGGAAEDGYRRGKAILDRLRGVGCPNYFAPARFGEDGSLAKWGRLLLQGKRLPRQVLGAGVSENRCLRTCQEWLFNRHLAQRVADGLLATVLPGDLVQARSGAIELVDDPERFARRLESWEIAPLGPLFGATMAANADLAATREAATLAGADLDADLVERLHGDRRAIRFQPAKHLLDVDGADLVLSCDLPTDACITSLVEELLKPEGHLA